MSNGRTLNNFTLADIGGNSVFIGGYITISLIPQLDDSFTFGAASRRWGNMYSSGICRLSGTTASTSTTTGTLICDGGVGIAGSLYVGGSLNIASLNCTTLTASGLITGQAGLTISTGSTSLLATTTTTLGCTTLTASGLITGQAGLTISTGSTSLLATTTTTLGCTTITASGLITGQAGLTISTGSTSLLATTTTTLGCTTLTASGLITGQAGLTISTGSTSLQAATTTTISCTGAATLCSSSGTCTIGSTTSATISNVGRLTITNTQDYDDTSGIIASIQTSGGVYAAKQIYNETSASFCKTSGTCTIGATNAVTITTTGILTVPSTTAKSVMHGAIYSTSSGYRSIENSQHMICGTYTYGVADHASQLVLLDNSSTAGSGGNCGAIVFAGPAKNFGGVGNYMAAGRIRASNGSGSYYGTMYLETLTTGGNLVTAITIANDQSTTFAAGVTVSSTTDVSGSTASITTSGGIYAAKKFQCLTAATLCSSSGTCTIGATTALTVSTGGLVTVNNTTDYSDTLGITASLLTLGGFYAAKKILTEKDATFCATSGSLSIGISGTTSHAAICGNITAGLSANTTNGSNYVTVHGYFTNKTPSASYSNGSIVLVNNYTTSISSSTPAMHGIKFTSNTRAANTEVTWSTVMGYAASLTATNENCGILWCTTNAGTLAERMRLDNGGCLSIGNTTSSGMLNVGSSTAFRVTSAGVVVVNNTTEATSDGGVGSVIVLGGCFVDKQLAAFSPFSFQSGTFSTDADRTIGVNDFRGLGVYIRDSLTATRIDTIDTTANFTTQCGYYANLHVIYVNNSSQNVTLKASTGWNNFIGAQFTTATAINAAGATIAVGTGITIAKQQVVLLILDLTNANIYVK